MSKFNKFSLTLLCSATLTITTMTACSAGNSNTSTSQEQGGTGSGTGFPMEIDNCGQKLVVEKRPEKVLTIGAGPLAQMSAAGAGDKVVSYSALLGMELPELPGVTAKELTSEDPSTEQILSTGADFLVANAYLNTDPKTLKGNGITSWVPSSVCDHLVASSGEKAEGTVSDKPALAKVQDDLKTMGRLFGTSETADKAADDLMTRVKKIADQNPGKGRSVALLYYFDGKSALGAIGDGGIPAEFAKNLGLKNVFADQKETWINDVSWESVLQKDPDIILLITEMTPGMDFEKNKERLLAEKGVDHLKAVKNDSFIQMKYQQGIAAPSSVEGLESLAGQLNQ